MMKILRPLIALAFVVGGIALLSVSIHLPGTRSFTAKLAFNGTPSGDFLFAALVFAVLKLISTVIQIVLMRGNYRIVPATRLFKTVYLAGKVTPALALACAFVSAMLLHDGVRSWLFGCLGLFVALLAIYVVRLRRQGRFFGVLDLLSSKRN
jgi:hypothetical protein